MKDARIKEISLNIFIVPVPIVEWSVHSELMSVHYVDNML